MDKKPKVSIVVPVYEMYGKGVELLKRNLDSIKSQTFKDYEIVIPDNSDNDEIANLIEALPYEVKYFKNPRKGMACNTNEGIKASKGELIKILYQDDYFALPDSLEKIIEAFTEDVEWLATGCLHLDHGVECRPHQPVFNHEMFNGNNMIGSPSVITFRNKEPSLMDESLRWVLDLDLYIKMYNKLGLPHYLYDLNVVIGLGNHQTTNALSEQLKSQEVNLIKTKNE